MTIPDIPFDREAIRVGIEGLIAKYRSMQEDIRAGRLRLNEANVRSDFIDVLFQLLGWDIHDARQYDLEHYIRGEGYADIALIYEGEPKVFIEAKKFGDIRSIIGGRFIVSDSGERISTDLYSDENQVLGYAYSKGIRWSIYTNFEIFRAYNEHNRAIINIERMEEYPTRIDDLLYLTRDAVISGRINELQTREERPDIDLEFLNQMKKWRLSLAESVYTSNLSLFNLADVQPEERKAKLEEINRIAQRILDRLIIIRFAEDKLVIPPDQLKARNDAWKLTRRYSSIWNDVKEFFNRFNDRHDSKIFERGHSSERVNIPDDIISRIIDDLYRICFRRFTSDILGNTYEMYLGYKLVVVEGRIQFEEDPEHLRDEGIYYTPSYIVEFITKEILGKRLNKIKEGIYQAINERQSPRIRELLLEVSALRILDPSCGSGSFLIKSLETLLQFYSALIPRLKEYNRAPHAMAMTLRPDEIDRLSTRVPEIENPGLKIIEENIFGIDLDETAVEIAAINVILQTLQKDMMLPNIIGQNLRMGNSLVFGDASTLAPLYGPQWAEVHPFNWETEFPDTKFEMIVGNPPYIAWNKIRNREFFESNSYLEVEYRARPNHPDSQPNIYLFFLIRAVQLCADSLGFIIPQEWKSEDRATEFRDYLLSVAQSIKIIRFNPNFHVFKTATGPVGTTSLIIFIYFKAPPNEVGKITEYYIDEMNERMVKEILSSEDQLMARATILSEDFQTFQGRSWKFHPIPVSNLRRKIMTLPNITHFENDPSIRVCGGFQPPGGEIERFSISQVEHDLLSPRERELAYPSCVIASQIKRYWIDRAGEYLIIANDVQTEQSLRTDYPGIFRILTGRIAHREGNWWMFRNIRNLPLIQTAALKLLSPRTAPINSFALDDRHSVIKGTDTFIYSDTIDIRYILGILNSRLGSYWYAHFGQDYHLGESMRYEPDKVNLYSIPIRIPQNEEQTTSIVELVGKLNRLYEMMNEIKKRFEEILQTATSIARLSTFGRYFDHSTEFDFSKVVFNSINTVRGKIIELRILSSRTRI